MTLAEFLLARIAEDEAAATRAKEMHGEVIAMWSGSETDQDLTSVGDYSADRALADCGAKRRIVAEHPMHAGFGYGAYCQTCVETDNDGSPNVYDDTHWPCPTLRFLAAPYAGHPEYLDAWRPDTP